MKIRMKSPLLMIALLAAGVAVAGTAIARGGDCAHEPRDDRAGKVSMMKERHAERVSTRLDGLAERLDLRAGQRPAWDSFRESFAAARPHAVRGDASATVSAPERMQGMERAAEARLEQTRRMRQAVEGLYAVLDADQRKLLDEQQQRPHRAPGDGPRKAAPQG